MTGALARYVALGACAAMMSAAKTETAAGFPDEAWLWRVQAPATSEPAPARPLPQLNTLRDVGNALDRCWRDNLPPQDQARPGMTVTVMLAFTKTGALLGEPRFTYITPEASAETKALYQRAAVAAINACTPLPISESLGGALAGSPKIMRFVDQRNLKGA